MYSRIKLPFMITEREITARIKKLSLTKLTLSDRFYSRAQRRLFGSILTVGINTFYWLGFIIANGYLTPHYLGAIIVVLSITGLCWVFTGYRCGDNVGYIKFAACGIAFSVPLTLSIFGFRGELFFLIGVSIAVGAFGGTLVRDTIIQVDE